MRATRAVYPGSFDPPTNGHLDVIARAARCFGELLVAIVVNPQKRQPMFSLEEREAMLKASVAAIANVRVEHFRGLLADYVRAAQADVIVKGLRVVSDFESEMSAALMNRSLSDVDTLFLMSDQKYSFVSSSLVKEVFFLGGDVAALVPEPVLRVMTEKRTHLQRR
ncbi:MAG TPA: pantetheine-phosphate adenylyltransferase [Candidatus Cybelea sp.]|jgi:pantetheine-phosphate adenylyltransferase|nr:pantetheine-phosphate adenylyltransferase [Candidatus Cybelea sp.]